MDILPLPPWTKLGKKLESICRKGLYDYDMLDNTDSIVIGLSGGKDSMTLLCMLHAILGYGFPKLKIHAILVSPSNPPLEKYLSTICRDLDVNFIVHTIEKIPNSCYSCSRQRRTIIFEKAKKLGSHLVALGHHRDDNIQTLLMNLLHKGEFCGLLPKIYMKKYEITIIRPLILASEADIIRFSQYHGYKNITCQCLNSDNSMRKKTEELISEIEKLYPNIRVNLSHAALNYGSDKANR
jgi:tRNA 2-thiocytidine biosynthesis protein TtcA